MPGKRGRRGSPGRRSRTARAELSFSVSHMERLLREGHYVQRLSSSAPVYPVAVIQYRTARVLELAGHEAQNSGRRRLTPELVDVAARSNALLSDFFTTSTISQVAPAQHQLPNDAWVPGPRRGGGGRGRGLQAPGPLTDRPPHSPGGPGLPAALGTVIASQ
ncbi:histone H2A-Bbd type 2/3-like [Kogia breviceps]|uniref:histone H2A-Bbd type 2/3-like n=1 Tax=Kogia breviceps TaxID=27615 RepID=UPI0027959717|nr:histone H2A-Bbd type 2/3-like [Kogia breviceps]